MYGRCARVLVPVGGDATVDGRGGHAASIGFASGGAASTRVVHPAAPLGAACAANGGVGSDRPALLYVGRLSKEKGLALLPELQDALRGARIDHRLIITGEGPMRGELAEHCPDAVFTGPLGREDVADVVRVGRPVRVSERDRHGRQRRARSAGVRAARDRVRSRAGRRRTCSPGLSGVVCDGRSADAWADAHRAAGRDPSSARAGSRRLHARELRAVAPVGSWR